MLSTGLARRVPSACQQSGLGRGMMSVLRTYSPESLIIQQRVASLICLYDVQRSPAAG